jgi:ribosomal protein S18 acetylase RimI-like enzyme
MIFNGADSASSDKSRNKKCVIRSMELADIKNVADVHIKAFDASALTRLGAGAVQRYYLWQLKGPHDHFPIIAVVNDSIVGFCVGGISRGALGGFLRKNKFYLAYRTLLNPSLMLNNKFMKRLKTAVALLLKNKKKTKVDKLSSPDALQGSFGILAICVIPEVQGFGISQELMAESEKIAVSRGFEKMHLTVASENSRAIKFYEKLGYSIKNDYGSEGNTFMEKKIRR